MKSEIEKARVAKMGKSKKITPKQQRFVEEYLIDLNAAQAALRAGFSPKTAAWQGSKLLQKTTVQIALAEAKSKRIKRVEITQDYVLANLVEIVERTMQRAPVTNSKGEQILDEDGNNLWTFDAKNANRALELLGKHLGIFSDKVDVSNSDGSLKQLPQAIRIIGVEVERISET